MTTKPINEQTVRELADRYQREGRRVIDTVVARDALEAVIRSVLEYSQAEADKQPVGEDVKLFVEKWLATNTPAIHLYKPETYDDFRKLAYEVASLTRAKYEAKHKLDVAVDSGLKTCTICGWQEDMPAMTCVENLIRRLSYCNQEREMFISHTNRLKEQLASLTPPATAETVEQRRAEACRLQREACGAAYLKEIGLNDQTVGEIGQRCLHAILNAPCPSGGGLR
jgi:hypothetical protein